MNNVPVEQICATGIVSIEYNMGLAENEKRVEMCIERTYRTMHERAKTTGKVLMGITQSMNTETVKVGEPYSIIAVIITLVGTVVDAAAVEAQQRMQQFDPRHAIRGRNNLNHAA